MRHATLDSQGLHSTGIRLTIRSRGYLIRGLLAASDSHPTHPIDENLKTGFHRCGITKVQLPMMIDWRTKNVGDPKFLGMVKRLKAVPGGSFPVVCAWKQKGPGNFVSFMGRLFRCTYNLTSHRCNAFSNLLPNIIH